MIISQTKVSPEWMTLSNLALSHLSPWLFSSITWKQRCPTGCLQPYHLSPESFIVWSKKRKKSLLEAAKEAQEGRPEIWCLGWGRGRGQTGQGTDGTGDRRGRGGGTCGSRPAHTLCWLLCSQPHISALKVTCCSIHCRTGGRGLLPKVTSGEPGHPTRMSPASVSVHP